MIPVYQRNYDWKIEQCAQLYEDLIRTYREDRNTHFFGSIVSVQNEMGRHEEYLIIDGQQRLTTVSLLFLAMYHLIDEAKVKVDNYIYHQFDEETAQEFIWERGDHLKASKIFIEHKGLGIASEGQWKDAVAFLIRGIQQIDELLIPIVEQYYN